MEDWQWRPEAGRWRQEEHGRSALPAYLRISTTSVPVRNAYEYWREVAFTDFEADHRRTAETAAYRASAAGIVCETADFFVTESDEVAGTRSRKHIETDGLDCLSIGLVLSGQRNSFEEDETSLSAGAGSFFVYDAAKASRVQWSRHKGMFLLARREAVRAILGPDIPSAKELTQRLAQSPTASLLKDQFVLVARHMTKTSPMERAFLIEQTQRLALFALANPDLCQPEAKPYPELVDAACRLIDRQLADPKLDATRLAKALNCSRSTLYRAFAAHDLGISELIRDMRLDKARHLIETVPPSISITEIALRCGLYDTTNFARQFRRRFGIAPSDVRNHQS